MILFAGQRGCLSNCTGRPPSVSGVDVDLSNGLFFIHIFFRPWVGVCVPFALSLSYFLQTFVEKFTLNSTFCSKL